MTKNDIIEKYESWSFRSNDIIKIRQELEKLKTTLASDKEYMIFYHWQDKSDKDIIFISDLVIKNDADGVSNYEEFIVFKY
ncbi:MAG: hypothetical protein ACYC97_09760 [Metallibacterium sp.]